MALRYVTSSDEVNWSSVTGPGNAVTAGAQLVVYRGEYYGAYSTPQNAAFIFKLVDGQIPPIETHIRINWPATDRITLTTIEDWLYMVWLNPSTKKVNLAHTRTPLNNSSWTYVNNLDCGLPAAEITAPAACGFDGRMYIAAVTAESKIIWTRLRPNGSFERIWGEIPGYLAATGPAFCIYNKNLHIMWGNKDRTLLQWTNINERYDLWWEKGTFAYNGWMSAPAATVHNDNKMYVSWTSSGRVLVTSFDGENWTGVKAIPNVIAGTAPGMGAWNGKIYISAAAASFRLATDVSKPRLAVANAEEDNASDDEFDKEKLGAQLRQDNAKGDGPQSPRRRWLNRFLCL